MWSTGHPPAGCCVRAREPGPRLRPGAVGVREPVDRPPRRAVRRADRRARTGPRGRPRRPGLRPGLRSMVTVCDHLWGGRRDATTFAQKGTDTPEAPPPGHQTAVLAATGRNMPGLSYIRVSWHYGWKSVARCLL